MSAVVLNEGQAAAVSEIMESLKRGLGGFHLLTGSAGTGKTTLTQELARLMLKMGLTVVAAAPTHKAVAVIAGKLKLADIDIPCMTIQKLLSLRPETHGDRLLFKRAPRAEPVTADVVILDEASMLSSEIMKHIRRHLPVSFVLFIGDPAQLPPVGEIASECFDTKRKSHLSAIVRQAEGNPVISATIALRACQGGPMDWSWTEPKRAAPFGVFRPGTALDKWLEYGFTSTEFDADPDRYRYLCWTNSRVAEVNRKIRRWRYGDSIPTPFMPGERALIRSPIVRDESAIFNTNEEVTVVDIQAGVFRRPFQSRFDVAAWTADMPSWQVLVRRGDEEPVEIHSPRDDRRYQGILDRLADEALSVRDRWNDFHAFKQEVANLQAIYAMTVHNSQGSTFRNAFVDVGNIAGRLKSNLLEAQQMFYVAASRPSHALVLANL